MYKHVGARKQYIRGGGLKSFESDRPGLFFSLTFLIRSGWATVKQVQTFLHDLPSVARFWAGAGLTLLKPRVITMSQVCLLTRTCHKSPSTETSFRVCTPQQSCVTISLRPAFLYTHGAHIRIHTQPVRSLLGFFLLCIQMLGLSICLSCVHLCEMCRVIVFRFI